MKGTRWSKFNRPYAKHLGRAPTVLDCQPEDILGAFPDLVRATDSPAIETSAAALLRLAECVHQAGHRVVLSGEGADEWQGGYPWFHIQRKLEYLDVIPGLRLSRFAFRSYVRRLHSRRFPWRIAQRDFHAVGGSNAWMLPYILLTAAKHRFFSKELWRATANHVPYDDLQLSHERMARWAPLNRSVYLGARVHLMGLHMIYRTDRPAMRSSLQLRFPFLDEEVFDFLARLHPRWKINNGRDKHLQRLLAERWLPAGFAAGRKRLIHGPLDAFHRARTPRWVDELLSEESLRRTGYFDVRAVSRWRREVHRMPQGYRRMFIEMALVGVISTQLWHHVYFDSGLADLPSGAPIAASCRRRPAASETARASTPAS
jgi:asparagine synthase (glutamine-hydrolysing)